MNLMTTISFLATSSILYVLLAGSVDGCRSRRSIPQMVKHLVDIEGGLSTTMSDKLAAEAKKAVAGSLNGSSTIELDSDAVEALVALGVLGEEATKVFNTDTSFGKWTVPVRMELMSNVAAHADVPLPGEESFLSSALVYLTDAKGSLHFPRTNDFVNITKGRVVAFPAGEVHEVLDSEPRIFLGPFAESLRTNRRKARNCFKCVTCTRPTSDIAGIDFAGETQLDDTPSPGFTVNLVCSTGYAGTATATACSGPGPYTIDNQCAVVPPPAWNEMRGCCRERVNGVPKRKRYLSHHDNLIRETEIIGETMAAAEAICKADCAADDLCTAFELHKSKKIRAKNAKKSKKKSKGYKCELHKAAINSSTRKSKSCKKAKCFTKKTSAPAPAPAPTPESNFKAY